MWKMIRCEICGRDIASSGWVFHREWHKRDKPCKCCGKMVHGVDVFCSLSCSAKFNNNRKGTGKSHFCVCGKPVGAKYCSKECQDKHEYDEYISKWLDGEVSGSRGKKSSGSVSNYIRRWLFERSGGKCEALLDDGSRCEWSRVNKKSGKIPLTIHHKDGNPERHRPDNLEMICPCCHSLTETYGSLNYGKGRKGRPGSMKIEKSGVIV